MCFMNLRVVMLTLSSSCFVCLSCLRLCGKMRVVCKWGFWNSMTSYSQKCGLKKSGLKNYGLKNYGLKNCGLGPWGMLITLIIS